MPVFYHNVMYRENTEEKDAAFLKLYDGHDWKWFAVRLKHTDMEYLRKHWSGKSKGANVGEKARQIFPFLRMRKVSLNRTPVKEQTICSVDLGIKPRMQSVPSCVQTELSWEESLLTFPVTKTGCTVRWTDPKISAGTWIASGAQGRWAYAKRLNIEAAKNCKKIVFLMHENKAM